MKAQLKRIFLVATVILYPSVTMAAAEFDTMFGGGKVATLDEWVQVVWSWLATMLIPASTIMLMAAGYIYMTAGGDPQKVEKARKIIFGVFSGLLILLLSYFFLTQVIGLDANVWRFTP